MNSEQARKPPFEAYKGIEPYVFISYAHSDGDAVFEHLEQLRSRGVRIWYDEGIDPGNEWPEEIARALDRCSLFLFFVSPRSVISKNCRDEVNFALNASKPFLAIHMEETTLPVGLSLRMGSIQAIMHYRMPEEAYWRKVLKVLDPFRVREGAQLSDAFDQGLHMPPVPVPVDEFTPPGRTPPPTPLDIAPNPWDESTLPVHPASRGTTTQQLAAQAGQGHAQQAAPVQGHNNYNTTAPRTISGGVPVTPTPVAGTLPYIPTPQPVAPTARGTYQEPNYAAAAAATSTANAYGATSSSGLQPHHVIKILLALGVAFMFFMMAVAGIGIYLWKPWETSPGVATVDGDTNPAEIKDGKTVRVEALGFAYTVPGSWTVKTDKEISKYELAIGPKMDDFTNNINVVDEDYSGNIDQYVEANMVTLRKEFKNLKVVSSGSFPTSSGMEGRRVITEHNTFNGRYLRQTFYFYKPKSSGKTWVVFTSSCTRNVGEKSQPLFDGIARTIRSISSSDSPSSDDDDSAQKPVEKESPKPVPPPPATESLPELTKKLDGDIFTYMVPQTWDVRLEKDRSKYKMAFGKRTDDFTSNIIVVDEEYTGTLKEYVDANLKTLNKSFKNLKIVSNTSFVTNSGLEGWKMVTEHNTFNERDVRQTFYFFKAAAPKLFLVATTSSVAKVGASEQPLFDGIMKTFAVNSSPSSYGNQTPAPPAPKPADDAPDAPIMSKEVRDTNTGFSFKLPSDWYTKKDSKSKYELAYGPTTGDFTSNINVVDESYSGNLSSYVDANLISLKKFKNVKIIDNDGFVTSNGLEGVRVITEHNNFNDRYLRQCFYFFKSSKPGLYLILTSTAPLNVGEEQQPMMDNIVRTFRTFPPVSGTESTLYKELEMKKSTPSSDTSGTFSGGTAVKLDSLGFSYMVPSSWTVTTDTSISKYPLARGPTSSGFTANFNAVDEDFTGGIDAYVEANMVTLRKSFKNLKVVQQGRFTTDSGVEGRRVITEHNTFNDRYLRQTFYFFKSSKGKTWVVLTSSTLQSNGGELQPTFDSIMRTLRQVPVLR
ncbi:MAG: TIR domain-containing protein [Candidatus Methylacidiphilales bacterium]|nr:toll/interleukin-1 receptor domain-containing protein [Candidatus Methylacidiphilales bacterium]